MHTDIGAGTGILSLFAKSAGASKIYAVEASPMAVHLKKVILKNKAEDVIKVLHQMVEDVELTERVDIIIRYLLTYIYFVLVVGISATMCHSTEKIPAKEGCESKRVSKKQQIRVHPKLDLVTTRYSELHDLVNKPQLPPYLVNRY